MPPQILRFAPSPNGHLHLGHALSALINQDMAHASGGRLLLRIEDIDRTRCRPEYEAAMIEDLAWLGVTFDGEVRRQSEHFDCYRGALDRLEAAGLIYPCFCTRAAIQAEIAGAGAAPHGSDGPLYPGTCRALSTDERQARIAAGEGYVRSVRGERGRWYREAQADPNVVIRVDGRAINVRAVPVTGQESISTVTAAIEEKYTGIPGLEPMLRPDVLDATLRLESA